MRRGRCDSVLNTSTGRGQYECAKYAALYVHAKVVEAGIESRIESSGWET